MPRPLSMEVPSLNPAISTVSLSFRICILLNIPVSVIFYTSLGLELKKAGTNGLPMLLFLNSIHLLTTQPSIPAGPAVKKAQEETITGGGGRGATETSRTA